MYKKESEREREREIERERERQREMCMEKDGEKEISVSDFSASTLQSKGNPSSNKAISYSLS